MNSKLILRIAINTAIGAVLIFFWLKLVDVKAVIAQLKQVDPKILPLPVALFLLASFLRSFRLKILLSEFKISVLNLWLLNMLSQLFSYTIPLRAGELIKAVYLSTNYPLSLARALVYVFIDRFLDFILTVILSLLLLSLIPTNLPSELKPTLTVTAMLISFVTLFILFLPRFCKKIVDVLSRVLMLELLKKPFKRFGHFVIDSVALLKKSPGQSISIVALTIFALIIDAFSWYVVFVGMSTGAFDFSKIQLGSMLSSLTYLIPAAPGYVGSAEASGLVVFSYGLGIDKTLVSAVTVLVHALTLLYMLLFGLSALYLLKFNFSLVWKKIKRES